MPIIYRASLIFGQSLLIRQSNDAAALVEGWATAYGSAFSIPVAFGGTGVMILDPKAIAHFFSNMEVCCRPLSSKQIQRLTNGLKAVYHLAPIFKLGIENVVSERHLAVIAVLHVHG
jgi:hypothetical protein